MVITHALLLTVNPATVLVRIADRLTPELAMKVKNVASVRVSPMAEKLFTHHQAIMSSDKSEFVSQIWIANTDGSDPLQ